MPYLSFTSYKLSLQLPHPNLSGGEGTNQ